MLQRQSKNNDLVIEVQGAGISKIEYYTDGLYKYMVDYSPIVYIPSSELQKMNDGQLRSTVYLSTPDNNFDDGSKDKTIDQVFDIWIGSEAGSANNYYTKDEIDQMGYLKEVPEEYITEEELEDKGYLTEHQPLTHLVTKDYLNDITYNFYTKAEVDKKITASGTFDDSQYYTKSEIDGRFNNIVTEIPEEYITESELTKDYYNKSEVDAKISSAGNFDSTQYYTKSEIDGKGYLTEHQSLANYALKSEIPDTTGLATKSEIPDVSNLATKTELTTAIGNIDTILDNINGEVV